MAKDPRSGARRRSGSSFWTPHEGEIPPVVDRVLAIDPGARHCGMAWFEYLPDHRWTCIQANKYDPFDCLEHAGRWINGPTKGVLVIEEFRLYPSKMSEQVMTSIGVVEVIGALRYTYGVTPRPYVGLVMQGASIKNAGLRRMEANGIEFLGKNQHARDAEMHGWYFVLAKLR